jgi:hypothetical protein
MRSGVLLIVATYSVCACYGAGAVKASATRAWTLTGAPSVAGRGVVMDVSRDADGDGLPDDYEDTLAQRFAPIVIHSSDESNLPTNVDAFLHKTSLAFHDDACDAGREIFIARAPSEADLVRSSLASPCDGARIASDGSRSSGKHETLYLEDVSDADRRGSEDSREWTTYVHVYPNDEGGVTLQYWRFYAYNDAFNDHGGDWEGIHVVLDAHGEVARVRFLQHVAMAVFSPRELQWEGRHVLVYSEGGGHASRPRGDGIVARGCAEDPCFVTLEDPATYVWQETWRGGRVGWPDGSVTAAGALINVGEKSAPLHGQLFLRYSGLWGSPGVFYGTSGYWGPAYNETGMTADGFIASWCAGMAGKLDRKRECWPADRER